MCSVTLEYFACHLRVSGGPQGVVIFNLGMERTVREAGVRCWWVLGDVVLRMLVLGGSRNLGRDVRKGNGENREWQRLGEREVPEGSSPHESPSGWLCTLGKPKTSTFCFLVGLGADTVSGLYLMCSGIWVQPQLKKNFPREMRLI